MLRFLVKVFNFLVTRDILKMWYSLKSLNFKLAVRVPFRTVATILSKFIRLCLKKKNVKALVTDLRVRGSNRSTVWDQFKCIALFLRVISRFVTSNKLPCFPRSLFKCGDFSEIFSTLFHAFPHCGLRLQSGFPFIVYNSPLNPSPRYLLLARETS